MRYVLVRDANGRHFEGFAGKHDAQRIALLTQQAEAGTLAGHVPQPGKSYSSRQYKAGPNRVMFKLTVLK